MSLARTAILCAALTGLAGCSYADLRLSNDFGASVQQSVASQIADPDARYAGTPAPGSDGARVALAQQRYSTGEVIPPVTPSTSLVRQRGAGQGGGQ